MSLGHGVAVVWNGLGILWQLMLTATCPSDMRMIYHDIATKHGGSIQHATWTPQQNDGVLELSRCHEEGQIRGRQSVVLRVGDRGREIILDWEYRELDQVESRC